MKLGKITINRKHEMFWNLYYDKVVICNIRLTVNMKCFEI